MLIVASFRVETQSFYPRSVTVVSTLNHTDIDSFLRAVQFFLVSFVSRRLSSLHLRQVDYLDVLLTLHLGLTDRCFRSDRYHHHVHAGRVVRCSWPAAGVFVGGAQVIRGTAGLRSSTPGTCAPSTELLVAVSPEDQIDDLGHQQLGPLAGL